MSLKLSMMVASTQAVTGLTAYGINATLPEFLAGVVIGLFGNIAMQLSIAKPQRSGFFVIISSFAFMTLLAAYWGEVNLFGFNPPPSVVIGIAGAISTILVRALAEKLPDWINKKMEVKK